MVFDSMTKEELIAILGTLGLTSTDGEDFGDGLGRNVRLRAPKLSEGYARVLWKTPDSGVPQRRDVSYSNVAALIDAAPKVAPTNEGPAFGSVGRGAGGPPRRLR